MTSAGTVRCLFAASLVTMATASQAAPVEWPVSSGGNGHFYEVVTSADISWSAANTAANGMFHDGVQGHLATLTSAAENAFVEGLRQPILGDFDDGKSEAWTGGFQSGSTEPGAGWNWVNEEGAISTSNVPAPGYSNWFSGEPNDAGGEDHLTLGRYLNGEWNDSDEANNAIGGYIVEYDGVADANDCKTSAGGCNPSGVQIVNLPDSVVLGPDDTLTQTLIESAPGQFHIVDPRVDSNGNCILDSDGVSGVAIPRESFDVFGDGSLILPPYLCGSPDFAVISSAATFDVLQDVIRHEQFPEEIFAQFYPCPGALGDADLQRRGVFGWQPDDRTKLPEQHAIDLRNGCGSSRGATASPSFFILNLHTDCGIPFGSNNAAVRLCIIDLTRSNYDFLKAALKIAKKSLTNTNYGQLQSLQSNSKSAFQNGNYALALQKLDAFIVAVQGSTFNDPGFNHQGHLLMRAEHIRFVIDTDIDP